MCDEDPPELPDKACVCIALSRGPHATRGPTNITWSINTHISKEASRRNRIATEM
jgi:hypothetical protein